MLHRFDHHHAREDVDTHSSHTSRSTRAHTHRDGSSRGRDHGPHHVSLAPPNTTVESHDADGNPPHRRYENALPSRLDTNFNEQPVTGTAIIGDDLPEVMQNESEFELVTPELTAVLETFAVMTLEEAPPRWTATDRESSRGVPTPSAQSHDCDNTVFSSRGTGSVRCPSHHKKKGKKHDEAAKLERARVEKERATHPHQVLNGGGYIIFSDKYLQAHPESRVAEVARRYSAVNPAPETKLDVNPNLPEEKQKAERAKFLIEQSEGDYRPLFRRRASALVYGRATYEPSDASNTESCASPTADTTSQGVLSNPQV